MKSRIEAQVNTTSTTSKLSNYRKRVEGVVIQGDVCSILVFPLFVLKPFAIIIFREKNILLSF